LKPTLGILRSGGIVVSNATGRPYKVGALSMAGKDVEVGSKQWLAFMAFFPRSVWITELLTDGAVKVEL